MPEPDVSALSYGGQAEIVDAARVLAERALAGELDPARIDEETFQGFLYIFTETLWPDFRKPELLKALEDFARRERRFGGV